MLNILAWPLIKNAIITLYVMCNYGKDIIPVSESRYGTEHVG